MGMKKMPRYAWLLIFGAVNLISFLIFFIPNYVMSDYDIGYFEYFRLFLNKFVEFALPALAACLLIKGYIGGGMRSASYESVFFALTRIIYLLPYYYLYFIAYGYDSVESILFSLAVSLFGALVMWGHVLILFLLMREVSAKIAIKDKIAALPQLQKKQIREENIKKLLAEGRKSFGTTDNMGKAFDFSHPLVAGIFAVAFGEFVIHLVREIVDTVAYLVDYAGYYRIGEIVFITISFLFILVELFASHAINYALIKPHQNQNEENV